MKPLEIIGVIALIEHGVIAVAAFVLWAYSRAMSDDG